MAGVAGWGSRKTLEELQARARQMYGPFRDETRTDPLTGLSYQFSDIRPGQERTDPVWLTPEQNEATRAYFTDGGRIGDDGLIQKDVTKPAFSQNPDGSYSSGSTTQTVTAPNVGTAWGYTGKPGVFTKTWGALTGDDFPDQVRAKTPWSEAAFNSVDPFLPWGEEEGARIPPALSSLVTEPARLAEKGIKGQEFSPADNAILGMTLFAAGGVGKGLASGKQGGVLGRAGSKLGLEDPLLNTPETSVPSIAQNYRDATSPMYAAGDERSAFALGGLTNDQRPFYGRDVGPKGRIGDVEGETARLGLRSGLPEYPTGAGFFNPATAALLQEGVQPKNTVAYYQKQMGARGGKLPPGQWEDITQGLRPDQTIDRDWLVKEIDARAPAFDTQRYVEDYDGSPGQAGTPEYQNYATKGPFENYSETVLGYPNKPPESIGGRALAPRPNVPGTFTDNHFDHPNMEGWYRTQDVNQGSTRIAEEVQPQRYQKMRDVGEGVPQERLQALGRDVDGLTKKLYDLREAAVAQLPPETQASLRATGSQGTYTRSVMNYLGKPGADPGNIFPEMARLADMRNHLQSQIVAGKKGVAKSPYTHDINASTDLLLKHLTGKAARDDVDRLAWTPGETQAERYNQALQKVKGLRYEPTRGTLYVKQDGQSHWTSIKSGVPREELGDYVGADVAKKLLATEAKPDMPGANYSGHMLEFPQGMALGGEGMKGFYGSGPYGEGGILTSRVKALWKKLTGQEPEVKPSKLPSSNSRREGSPDQYPSVDLTPEMRDTIRRVGLSMYSSGDEKAALGLSATASRHLESPYVILDRQTGQIVGSANTLKSAMTSVNTRDKRYGASRYTHMKSDNYVRGKSEGLFSSGDEKAAAFLAQFDREGQGLLFGDEKRATPAYEQRQLDANGLYSVLDESLPKKSAFEENDPVGEPFNAVRLDDDLRESIRKRGFPMFAAGDERAALMAGAFDMSSDAQRARARELGHFDTPFYHGTTHKINPREGFADPARSPHYEKEGHHGAAVYHTTSRSDASDNYGGIGPDLTNRLAMHSERKVDEIASLSPQKRAGLKRLAQRLEDEGLDVPKYGGEEVRMAFALAYQSLVGKHGDSGVVHKQSLAPTNPVLLGKFEGKNETYFGNERIYPEEDPETGEWVVRDKDGDEMERFSDEGEAYQYADDSSYDADTPLMKIADFTRMNADGSYGGSAADDLISQIMEDPDGVSASRLEKMVRGSDYSVSLLDSYEGGVGQFLQDLYRKLGHDAVVMPDANKKFPGMDMGHGTVHVATFDPANVRDYDKAVYDPAKRKSKDWLAAAGEPSAAFAPAPEEDEKPSGAEGLASRLMKLWDRK